MAGNRKTLSARLFLLKEMIRRDIRARYAGSGLGIAWAFAQPVLWMLLYTFVFSAVLRIPVESGFSNFPEFLMAGLLPWMAFSEGVSRCSTVLTDNAAMVKKTVFPLEMLVASVVLAAMVNLVIALAIFAVYVALLGHLSAPWLLLAVPALLLQTVVMFGIGCLVATLTTFVRDVGHAVGVALTVVFYATPIVYPAALVPARLAPILQANPMSHLVEWYRLAFTLHRAPGLSSVLMLTLFALASALGGGVLFFRARPHFADLI